MTISDREGEAGFSILEMLLVLLILALATGIAWPQFRPPGPERAVVELGNRIHTELIHLRARAIHSGQRQTMFFDVKTRSISRPGKSQDIRWPANIALAITATAPLAGDEVLAIRFFPDGTASGGKIRLSHQERVMVITVNWLTGGIVRSNDAG